MNNLYKIAKRIFRCLSISAFTILISCIQGPGTQSLTNINAIDTTPVDTNANITFSIESRYRNSIWPRIQAGLSLETDLSKRAFKAELKWYNNHHAYIERVMIRAEPFMFYILEEIDKRNMPTDLVLLPIVESAFQPFAYSHGRAAGIWQFIPATGRLYGLKQNWWYDGRRDIHASTKAALNYLQNLNKLFKGDWLHTLAAYNSGSGTVQKAIKRNKRQNLPTDFWHLKLPLETRTYVPKLLALKEMILNPEKYNLKLHDIKNESGFDFVTLDSQIDLALAADMADINLKTLYSYNPGLNRWATAPNGPHYLLLPVNRGDIFSQRLAELPVGQRITWKRHKIKNGETLSHIALKFNTTTRYIRKINKLRTSRIRAGKYLLIPVSSKNNAAYTLSANQRKKNIQAYSHGNKKIFHKVKKGESFWSISRIHNVGMHQIANWNGMAIRDRLKQGQNLVIWKNKSSKLPNNIGPSNAVQSISYTVRNGDSLSRIANRYKVTMYDIHRWNTIKGKYLQPGQKIKLYVDITEQNGDSG